MNSRRDFVKLAAMTPLAGVLPNVGGAAVPEVTGNSGGVDRAKACELAGRLATPLLSALAARRLKLEMPVEAYPGAKDRPQYTYLEGLGRLLAGLAPWLELDDGVEGTARARLAALAREGIDAATDPASADYMNFSRGRQPLVDAAFLAQALMRAPNELWGRLPSRVQGNVIAALRSSRPIPAGENNWKLFATMVEAWLHRVGEKRDEARLTEGIDKHRQWYLGDGMYGDGPEFHWDYYNSFVIQPMLLEALDVLAPEKPGWAELRGRVSERLTRWAAIQERMVAPDGSYPVVGRSIAYRCGAFQGLALAAWRGQLPAEVVPGQARVALMAVIRRTLEAPGTFDARGWLTIGLAGHQPRLGENYISTGSLYLCSVAFLPLGLPLNAPFWRDPAARTTWEKVWAGENLPADHAIKSAR